MAGHHPPGSKQAHVSALRIADAQILHFTRTLSTFNGVDTSLSCAYYTLTFLHSRLTYLLERQYEIMAFDLANRASEIVLPGEAMFHSNVLAPRTPLHEMCVSVKALTNMLSEYRMFTRLWGLLGIYTWARETYVNPPRDPMIRAIVWTQVAAGLGFQTLENLAFLINKGVVRGYQWRAVEDGYWRRSSQFWLLHVVLEAVKLLRERHLDIAAAESEQSQQVSKERSVKREEAYRKWKRNFYANAAWAPVALHWSLKAGESPVTETWIGLCGMLPGWLKLSDLWVNTAKA